MSTAGSTVHPFYTIADIYLCLAHRIPDSGDSTRQRQIPSLSTLVRPMKSKVTPLCADPTLETILKDAKSFKVMLDPIKDYLLSLRNAPYDERLWSEEALRCIHSALSGFVLVAEYISNRYPIDQVKRKEERRQLHDELGVIGSKINDMVGKVETDLLLFKDGDVNERWAALTKDLGKPGSSQA